MDNLVVASVGAFAVTVAVKGRQAVSTESKVTWTVAGERKSMLEAFVCFCRWRQGNTGGEAFNTFTFLSVAIYNNNGNIQWRWGRGMCQRLWRSEGVELAGLLVTVTSDDDDRGR